MRVIVQRVASAGVSVGGEVIAQIEQGLLLLVGIAQGDTVADALTAADKVASLRIFGDAQGRMNRSVTEAGGEALVVSQFTLLADVRKGRRPSFSRAADPEIADDLVNGFAARLGDLGVPVRSGRFGSHMQVESVNDGPVTIVVDVVAGRVQSVGE